MMAAPSRINADSKTQRLSFSLFLFLSPLLSLFSLSFSLFSLSFSLFFLSFFSRFSHFSRFSLSLYLSFSSSFSFSFSLFFFARRHRGFSTIAATLVPGQKIVDEHQDIVAPGDEFVCGLRSCSTAGKISRSQGELFFIVPAFCSVVACCARRASTDCLWLRELFVSCPQCSKHARHVSPKHVSKSAA